MKPAYIFLIMAGVIAFLLWRLNRVAGKLERTDSVLSEKTDSIRYWKSRSGKTVASKTAAEISPREIDKHYQDISAELKDMRIKLSQVRAVLKASIEATGEGKVIIVRDTIFAPGYVPFIQDSVFIDDSYLRLKAQVIPGTNESYLAYKYTYSDTVLWAAYDKKKWIFGNERLYADFRLSNPNARAVNMTSVLIRQRDKRFNVSIGAGYDPFTNQVRPGIYLGYSLIRL
jgi:hypothetical protein